MLEMGSATNDITTPNSTSSEGRGLLDLSRHNSPSTRPDSVLLNNLHSDLLNARMDLAIEHGAHMRTRERLEAQIAGLQAANDHKDAQIALMRQMISASLVAKEAGRKGAAMVRIAAIGGIVGRGMTSKLVEVFIKAAPDVFPQYVVQNPPASALNESQVMTDSV